MTDIADMLAAQLKLQRESFGKDPTRLTDEERAEFIRWNVLALTDELHEALGEVGWKPWATDRSIDNEAFLKELVDAWHFFMNLMLVGSGVEIHSESDGVMELETLAQYFSDRYMEKRKVNAQRQEDGYTGTDKCPSCKRDRKTTAMQVPVDEIDGQTGLATAEEVAAGVTREVCPCGWTYES